MSFRATLLARLWVAVALLLTPAVLNAGAHQEATFLVHLSTPTSKNACLTTNPPSCYGIETRGLIDIDYFAYVILGNLNPSSGVFAARFGITYDGVTGSGVDVYSWTSCADGLQFPVSGWPAPGGGNTMTWSACQAPTTDRMVIVGYFSLAAYGPDDIWVRPHPLSNQNVSDCAGEADEVTMGARNPFGWGTFSADGSSLGSTPCGLNNGSCHLSGPTVVDTGQTGIQYTMHPEEVTANGSWRVGGNAQITTSNNSTATVNAGTPGTFWIGYHREPDCWIIDGCGCSMTVTVMGPLLRTPITWGGIKARF